jgi:hypothetical protein
MRIVHRFLAIYIYNNVNASLSLRYSMNIYVETVCLLIEQLKDVCRRF